MSESTNLPERPDRPGAAWPRFRQDPRRDAELRASDSDRDVARDVLAEAYADGQLDHDEYLQRLEQAGAATRHGELVPLLGDLSVPAQRPAPGPAEAATPATTKRRRGLDPALTATVASWLFVAIVCNLIWVLTSAGRGEANYYWPMWPMLGVGIGVIGTALSRGAARASRSGDDSESDR